MWRSRELALQDELDDLFIQGPYLISGWTDQLGNHAYFFTYNWHTDEGTFVSSRECLDFGTMPLVCKLTDCEIHAASYPHSLLN